MRSSHVSARSTTLVHCRARLYTVRRGTFPAAGAALGLQPAAPAVSSGNPAVLVQVQAAEKYTTGQQSSGNRCDSSRCTVRSSSARPIYPRIQRVTQHHAPRKPGGLPRTAIISKRRCHANVDIRMRSPRCPSPASSHPCTSRAAPCGMPRPIAGGGSSSGTATSCICRVVVG